MDIVYGWQLAFFLAFKTGLSAWDLHVLGGRLVLIVKASSIKSVSSTG